MDFSKLSMGDKVLAGSGVALFIFSFFPWFGVDGYSGGRNGWDFFFWGIIPVLLGLILVGYVYVTKLNDSIKLPDLPIEWPLAVLGAAALAALLVVLKLLIGDSVDTPFGGVDLDRKFGVILSAIAAVGLAAGAFLRFKEDGGELPTKGGSTGGTTGDSGSATPF